MKVGDLVTYKIRSDLLSHEHKMMGIVVKVAQVSQCLTEKPMVLINWGWKNAPQRWNAIEYENRLKVVSDV